ncbi:MAG: trypsin-like peptidase domain-containing protein [Chloroflexi bacterium]|nr:trypsin-like peptidase domain-containing protein [Chloroflexota bacterium]
MPNILEEWNAEIASVVEDVERALVQIHSGGGAVGAGTIWHPDGLIVTNAHVVQRRPLQVTLADGRNLPAQILALDSTLDLAALVVEAAGLPTIELGDSRRLRPGEWVLAIGHPWGVRGAVTVGVVVGTESKGGVLPPFGGRWIVVDLPLRPGNSGGPLVDAYGRLVGVNTMVTGPTTGIAVPVHLAKAFLRETLGSTRVATAA